MPQICEIDRWENEGGPPPVPTPAHETRLARAYNTLPNRIGALKRRHATLHSLIDEEGARASRCDMTLQQLKRERLLVKDEIANLANSLRAA
jgi:hypothetical protein